MRETKKGPEEPRADVPLNREALERLVAVLSEKRWEGDPPKVAIYGSRQARTQAANGHRGLLARARGAPVSTRFQRVPAGSRGAMCRGAKQPLNTETACEEAVSA
jgi:hypothetical protein